MKNYLLLVLLCLPILGLTQGENELPMPFSKGTNEIRYFHTEPNPVYGGGGQGDVEGIFLVCNGQIELVFEDLVNHTETGFDVPDFATESQIQCIQDVFNSLTSFFVFNPEVGVTQEPAQVIITGLDNYFESWMVEPVLYMDEAEVGLPIFQSGAFADYLRTGTGNNPNGAEAKLNINIGLYYSYCDMEFDCALDFPTVILHGVGRLLGFNSFVKFDLVEGVFESTLNTPVFSEFDEHFIYWQNSDLYTGPLVKVVDNEIYAINAEIEPIPWDPSSNESTLYSYIFGFKIWLNDSDLMTEKDNHPIIAQPENYLGEIQFSMDAFYDLNIPSSFNYFSTKFFHQNIVSPQRLDPYVMEYALRNGIQRREFCKKELEVFEVLGYQLNNSNAIVQILENRPPYYINNNPSNYEEPSYLSVFFPEIAFKNYFNNFNAYPAAWYYTTSNCNPITINLSDLGLIDPENDEISIFNDDGIEGNDVYNIRGCGNGNNHDQLIISSDYKSIVFTPRNNFIGRAQFSFHTTDGFQKGCYVQISIDVTSDDCFVSSDNFLVNGNFEEATEYPNAITHPDQMMVENRAIQENFNSYELTIADGIRRYHSGSGSVLSRDPSSNCVFQAPHVKDMASFVPVVSELGNRVFENYTFSEMSNPAFDQTAEFFMNQTLLQCEFYKISFDYYGNYVNGNLHQVQFRSISTESPLGLLGPAQVFIPNVTFSASSISAEWQNEEFVFAYQGVMQPNVMRFATLSLFGGSQLRYYDNFVLELWTPNLLYNTPSCANTCSGSAAYEVVPNCTLTWTPETGEVLTGWSVDELCPNQTYTVTISQGNCQKSWQMTTPTSYTEFSVEITSPISEPLCAGEEIELNVSGNYTYTWSPASSLNTNTGSAVIANPSETTVYSVSAIDQNGCIMSDDFNVIVVPLPNIQSFSSSSEICSGSTLALWATGANSYSWSPSQYLNTPNNSATLANPPQTTTYTVVGVGENNCTSSSELTIIVNPLPDVFLTTSANSICQGEDVVLSTTSMGSIQWFENGNPIGSNSSSITVSPSITSQYTLSVTNELGCENSESLTITVLELPVISVNASNTEICLGNSLQLSASGGINYSWFPGNLVSDGNGASTNAFPTTNTQFIVLGQGINGCVNTAAIIITVHPVPNINLNVNDSSPCTGDQVNIVTNPLANADWFSLGVIQQENASSYSFTIQNETSITATVTNGFNCSASSTVVIEPLPLPDVSVVSDILEGCGDDIVNLQAFGAETYLWTPALDVLNGDGNIGSDMPLGTTTYSVLGTDMNGCKSEAQIEVVILPVCCFESPNPPVSYSVSGTQTWATGEYWLLQDLIVNAGSYLVISGSVLHFAEGKKLIVREGATVQATNTVFTNYSGCGYWEGVETRSTPTNRANLRFNFCTISYANTGFKNFETQDGNAISSSKGGQFGAAFQLIYKNNTRDMWFEHVVLPNASGSYQGASFSKCIFILDDGYYGAQSPKSRIYVNKINPLFFENCDIINLVEEFTQQSNCLIGLELYKSAFKMSASEAHYIKGFAYGIYQSYGTKWVSRVEDMTFNCYRGIYSSGPMNNILIYRNDFLDPIFASVPTYQMQGVFNSNLGKYGTYIQGNSRFDIQGNVYNSTPGTLSYGCVVNDAGSFNNRIRGNSFYGQSRAINIYNRNRGNTFVEQGLTFSCNNIDQSSSSSILTYSPDVPVSNTYRGPAANQGGSTSAGNNIYNASDYAIVADDIYNVASSPYTYRYHENDNLNLNEIYYQVSLFPSINENECEITYKNLNQLLIGQGEIQVVNSTLDLNKSNYLNFVDEGETEELTEEIIFSTYSDALELYYNLMSKSPALSEQVMIEAIEKEYDLPAVLLTQILASNPTAAKNENVKNAIESRMIPLEDYQKEQIEIGLSLLSSKEHLEADLTEMETKRAMLLLAMFDRIESDSSVIEKEVAKNALLYPNKYLNDRFLLINNFMESTNYPSARNLLLSISNFFKLNANDLKEVQNLISIIDILELNPPALSLQQLTSLETIIMNGGAISASYATNILVSYSFIEVNSPLYEVEGVNTPRSLFSSNERKNLNCNIYPNPTSNILTLDLKDLVATEIRLTDISGRIVLQHIGEWRGQHVLDISILANGGYSLTIVTNQEIITKEVFKVR